VPHYTRSAAVLIALLAATPLAAQPVLYVDNVNGTIFLTAGGSSATTVTSALNTPKGLAVDTAGNL
jgi:hypothetical protein